MGGVSTIFLPSVLSGELVSFHRPLIYSVSSASSCCVFEIAYLFIFVLTLVRCTVRLRGAIYYYVSLSLLLDCVALNSVYYDPEYTSFYHISPEPAYESTTCHNLPRCLILPVKFLGYVFDGTIKKTTCPSVINRMAKYCTQP